MSGRIDAKQMEIIMGFLNAQSFFFFLAICYVCIENI